MNTALMEITDEERTRRRAVRDRLKAEVKKPGTCGKRATVLCMMISHTRGKLHCRSYARYNGGWRIDPKLPEHIKRLHNAGRFEESDFRRYHKRLGSGCERRWAEELFTKAVIESWTDQREFLEQFLRTDRARVVSYKDTVAQGRTPYSWQTPYFDDELQSICEHIINNE